MPDGLELGGSQRAASFAHAVGDGFQCFFRGADNQRQTQQAQCQRTCQDAVSKIHIVDEQCHAEQTEHDGRDAAQIIRHHPYEAYYPAFRHILIHINAAHHSHRKSKQGTTRHQTERTYNGRKDSAGSHTVGRSCSEELPIDDSYTFIYNETEDCKKNPHHTQAQQTEQAECHVLRKMLPINHIYLLLFSSWRNRFHREVYQ